MKKLMVIALALVMSVTAFTACSSGSTANMNAAEKANGWNKSANSEKLSREESEVIEDSFDVENGTAGWDKSADSEKTAREESEVIEDSFDINSDADKDK